MTEYDEYSWVDRPSELQRLCEASAGADVIGIDTEFVRVSTFYPKVGLIQVADRGRAYLIDPLPMDAQDLVSLQSVLFAPSPIKVLHACGEDLAIFRQLWGDLPACHIFDTQLASAFLGFDLQISFQRLVEEVLQISVPKEETRSDWLQRPLSAGQRTYAALDVTLLLPLYDYLNEKLQRLERLDWVQEDCRRLLNVANQEISPDTYYQGIHDAWKLTQVELGVLKAVATWREEQARSEDRPRSFVLDDQALLAIARACPTSSESLSGVSGVGRSVRKRYGDQLLSLVSTALSAPEDTLPPVLAKPLPKAVSRLARELKAVAQEAATALNIPLPVLASRKYIQAFIHQFIKQDMSHPVESETFEYPDMFTGWRKKQIGEPFLNVCNRYRVEARAWRTALK